MEFSKPISIPLSKIYSYYKSNFIPLFGRVFSNNEEAYNYLNESIDMFPNQEILKNKIENVGFRTVKYINLFDGIVSIHTDLNISENTIYHYWLCCSFKML